MQYIFGQLVSILYAHFYQNHVSSVAASYLTILIADDFGGASDNYYKFLSLFYLRNNTDAITFSGDVMFSSCYQ